MNINELNLNKMVTATRLPGVKMGWKIY